MSSPIPPIHIPDVLPRVSPDIEIADFETELVAYNTRFKTVHLVRGIPALVLDACDGERTVELLVEEFVAAELGSPEHVRGAIFDAFFELVNESLIAGYEPSEGPPCIGCAQAAVKVQRGRWWRSARRTRAQA